MLLTVWKPVSKPLSVALLFQMGPRVTFSEQITEQDLVGAQPTVPSRGSRQCMGVPCANAVPVRSCDELSSRCCSWKRGANLTCWCLKAPRACEKPSLSRHPPPSSPALLSQSSLSCRGGAGPFVQHRLTSLSRSPTRRFLFASPWFPRDVFGIMNKALRAELNMLFNELYEILNRAWYEAG